MTEVVIATRNRRKLKELRELLAAPGIRLLDLGLFPGVPEIIEDGDTFEDNAVRKAVQVSGATGKICIADDSGLEVEALGGQPGVHSSRFAGPAKDDSENIKKLLQLMKDTPDDKRHAKFVCVAAVSSPRGLIGTVRGECSGTIARKESGSSGFGYDPVFIVPSYGKTFAELGDGIKNTISHRAVAIRKAKDLLLVI